MVWDPTETAQTPAQTPSQDKTPDLATQWNAYLSNPTVRAGLLGFGASMLQGGWGGFAGQLGQAVGAGAEAAGNVEATQMAQANKDAALGLQQEELNQNATLKREEIQARKDVATTMANSRTEAANIRSSRGPSNLQEQRMFLTAKQRRLLALENANLMDPDNAMDPVTLDALAAQQAMADLEQARANTGGGNAGAPVAQGGQTQQGPGGSVPTQEAPSAANVGAPRTAPSTDIAKPTTQAEFDALPKGTRFLNPKDKREYTKQ